MKRTVLAAALAAAAFSAASAPAFADGHEAKINAYIESNISGWLGSDEIIAAVDQQNIDHFGITAAEIERLDQRWRKEKKRGGGSLISSIMGNELSAFLRGIKAASGGVITEIFVMDNVGLNVGQTNGTGDVMQGDEAKWQKTYPVSAKAVYIDDVEEDGGVNVSQTSLTVARANGFRLGAVTIGINVDALK
jgi:opacity protein-like surface antigen